MTDFEYDYLNSLAKRNAILLCKDEERREYLKLLARTYQCIIVAESIDEAEEDALDFNMRLDQSNDNKRPTKIVIDLVLMDLCTDMEIDLDELSKISSYLIHHQIEAVVWTGLDDLDGVYAVLPTSQCHFLVDTDPLEAMPAMTGLTGREVMGHLSDISQDEGNDKEYAALHRISDELALMAKTIAKIVDGEEKLSAGNPINFDAPNDVDHKPIGKGPDDYLNHSVFKDKPTSFEPFSSQKPIGFDQKKHNEDTSPFVPTESDRPIPVSAISADVVKQIIKLRRMRENYFENSLFADPAWDILLDLMVARLSGQTVSVSSLCIAAAVPPTTALRWITSMTKNDMLVRQSDPLDARRVFIDLSDETFEKLETYLTKALENGNNII